MTEDEIMSTDLYTIYKLIDVHAKMNGVKTGKGNKDDKKVNDNTEVYIDSIVF